MIPYCILVIEDDNDREFMTLLFIRFQRLLYKEIYEILKNPWNTEDILQATLVKLIDKIPGNFAKRSDRSWSAISVQRRETRHLIFFGHRTKSHRFLLRII